MIQHVIAILGLSCLAQARAVRSAVSDPVECVALMPGGPLQLTPDCVDPLYSQPIIHSEVDLNDPVPHHKISGHFNGTTMDFNLYLPEKSAWEGRFYQRVYPLQSSTSPERDFTFGFDSGAYWVRTKGSLGYRADAAAAKLSRQLAREYYGEPDRRIYGYIYGSSGGSFMVVGGMENTVDVWDGALALVQAVPAGNPNTFCARALASAVLDTKSDLVSDAVAPGGGGYPSEGLNELERAVFDEVTALGLPVRAWEDFDRVARNESRTVFRDMLRTVVIPAFKSSDPSYVEDFWTKPGYAGAEDSLLGEFFRDALIDLNTTIREVHVGPDGVPVALILDEAPGRNDSHGLEFFVRQEDGSVGSFFAQMNGETNEAVIFPGSGAKALAALASGSELNINNRWWLSVHTCHRHQVPTRPGFYGFDFLRDAEGQPLYPQRDILLSPISSRSTSGGGNHTGKFSGKMIVMDTLLDYDALPWHADWYRTVVREAIGEEAFRDKYRLYYTDNADHYNGEVARHLQGRIVDFMGVTEQHLRDLAAWTEDDITPPKETRYSLNSTQVQLPDTACQRRGIQPIVKLSVGDDVTVHAAVGEAITFKVFAEAPPATGKIVSLEWDPQGTGDYVPKKLEGPSRFVEEEITHAYQIPGTYFPVVRVASHRTGDVSSPFARPLNLARLRVIVKE